MSFYFSRLKFVKGIAQLLFYQTNVGNMDVAKDYVTPDNFPLGEFVYSIRQANKEGYLTQEEKDKLEEIGFSMEKKNQTWETMFTIAKRYVAEHNGRIPRPTEQTQEHILIGAWIRKQIMVFYRLEEVQQEKLKSAGIWPGDYPYEKN